MEESETITTDTNSSIVARSIQQNEGASNDRIINNQSYAVAEKPNADSNTSDTTTFSAPSSRSVASSAVSFHPPPSAPQTPVHAPLNEKECKRKFVKFVLAANKYRQRKGTKKPTRMSLIFDANDDVETMCVIRQGKAEYHKFNG
jgi:hypothetical protein